MNKRIIWAAIAFIAVVALFLTVYFVTRPEGTAGEKNITVTIVHSDGNENVLKFKTDREFLADALIDKGVFTAEDIASGLTEWVDGEQASWEKDQAYWGVYIGEEMANFGMKEIPLEDGGVYSIVYTVSDYAG